MLETVLIQLVPAVSRASAFIKQVKRGLFIIFEGVGGYIPELIIITKTSNKKTAQQ